MLGYKLFKMSTRWEYCLQIIINVFISSIPINWAWWIVVLKPYYSQNTVCINTNAKITHSTYYYNMQISSQCITDQNSNQDEVNFYLNLI